MTNDILTMPVDDVREITDPVVIAQYRIKYMKRFPERLD